VSRARQSASSSAAMQTRHRFPWFPGGVEGNARLTATSGLVLLVLLFVEGLTLVGVRQFITVHIFVGLWLIPPVAVKLASTGYRFVRYYTGAPTYRAVGPPHLIPRIIAPLLVATTIGVLGTGVVLLLQGPGQGEQWRHLHTLFFIGWFCVMTVHFLAYIWRAPALALRDVSGVSSTVRGIWLREGMIVGGIILGLVLAIAFLPLDSSWTHFVGHVGHNG
jgi:hypothetical protein